MQNMYSLSNITLITPDKVHRDQCLKIDQKRIAAIGAKAKFDISSADGDLFLYPALINVHDHLRGDYLPRVGPKPGNYYLNWAPWDNDLKSSEVYKERANITIEQSYFLGAYKNLFSGVVTVNDHFPHEFNEEFIPVLPIRVIQNYTLVHECSSYDLKWGEGIEAEHARAVKNNYPFITHLEEGFDEESQRGIEILEELHCLDDYDILIHCIGFSDEDIKKTKKILEKYNLDFAKSFVSRSPEETEKISKKIGQVRLPKFGIVKFIATRQTEGKIKNVTISKEGDKWNISFDCEIEKEIPQKKEGFQSGIDRGIVTFAKLSNNTDIPAISVLKKNLTKIKKLQRKLKKKTKFSSNWKKAKKSSSTCKK